MAGTAGWLCGYGGDGGVGRREVRARRQKVDEGAKTAGKDDWSP